MKSLLLNHSVHQYQCLSDSNPAHSPPLQEISLFSTINGLLQIPNDDSTASDVPNPTSTAGPTPKVMIECFHHTRSCVTNNIAVPKYEEEIGDDKKYEVTCKVSEAISAQAWDLNKKHARILAAKKGKLVENIM